MNTSVKIDSYERSDWNFEWETLRFLHVYYSSQCGMIYATLLEKIARCKIDSKNEAMAFNWEKINYFTRLKKDQLLN